jgi:hypothetical protein
MDDQNLAGMDPEITRRRPGLVNALTEDESPASRDSAAAQVSRHRDIWICPTHLIQERRRMLPAAVGLLKESIVIWLASRNTHTYKPARCPA